MVVAPSTAMTGAVGLTELALQTLTPGDVLPDAAEEYDAHQLFARAPGLAGRLSDDELAMIARNSFGASFLDETTKTKHIAEVDKVREVLKQVRMKGCKAAYIIRKVDQKLGEHAALRVKGLLQ